FWDYYIWKRLPGSSLRRASKPATAPCRRLLGSGGSSAPLPGGFGLDVLVHAEEIVRIVLSLDGSQAIVILPVGGPNAIVTFFHHEVDVGSSRGIGVQILEVAASPVCDLALVGGIRIHTHNYLSPRGISVGPSRVRLAYTMRSAINRIHM